MKTEDRSAVEYGRAGEADATLRVVANLPAPEGLAERVRKGVRAEPKGGRVLAWRTARKAGEDWLRGAAAAAIVCLVAGGAWWIYANSAAAGGGSAIAAPVRVRTAGGFSNAGAIHTPNTLNGPVLKTGGRDQGTGTEGQGTRDKGEGAKTSKKLMP